MKKNNYNLIKIVIFILIILSNITFAQDKYPKPFKLNYYNNGTLYNNRPLDSSLFKQESFWLGTQWGGNAKILKALKMNGNHGTQPYGASTNQLPSINTGTKLQYIHDNKGFNLARGFQFEPTLHIPQSQRGELITRNSQIWGFSHRLGNVTNDINDVNYERLCLLKNASYVNSIVLEKSWINNQYLYYPEDKNSSTNGKQWVFSINLRRVDSNEVKLNIDTGRVKVLTIKLPYTKVKMSGLNYIKFNKTSQNINNKELLSYSPETGIKDTLGYNVLFENIGNDTTTEFTIYDDMLPDSLFIKNNKRQDITLNAYFLCDGILNSLLKINNNDNGKIDSLDIEVRYHGNTDIAINHLRIATAGDNDFFLGKNYDDNKLYTQQAFDNLYQNAGYEPFGKYLRDEAPEPYFSMMRYVAEIFNFEVFSEGAGGDHMNHFIEHVKPKTVWLGAIGMLPAKGSPYFWPNTIQFHEDIWLNKYGGVFTNPTVNGGIYKKATTETEFIRDSSIKWMYYGVGHTGMWSYSDSLKSTYETDMGETDTFNIRYWRPLRQNYYPQDITLGKLRSSPSTLSYMDFSNYHSYYRKNNILYLYEDKPWWTNSYPVGNWGFDTSKSKNQVHIELGSGARPKTAEEVRLELWNRLIFGTKGFCYDSRSDRLVADVIPRVSSGNNTIGVLGNENSNWYTDKYGADSLIYGHHASVGDDFIPDVDSITNIHLGINKDSISKYLRVPKNRIYYGRRSPRIEKYKMHSFIRANDKEIMDMRLQATFSKGTLIFENQHPSYTDTLLNKLVKMDRRQIILDNDSALISDIGVKSRPIGRKKNNLPHYESYDSTFFDLTIHKNKNRSIDSVFYIAVLNKRTDPLILIDTLPNEKHLLFLTDDEFGKLCREGGKNPLRPNGYTYDSTYWQNLWWKRLGAREITLPFDYVGTNTNNYNLLKIEELQGEYKDSNGIIAENNLPFHLRAKYNQKIDTVMGQDGKLVLKLLPGQGKILKVSILQPDLSVTGQLAHPNQSKLVAYPILRPNGEESDSIQYHLVYFRKSTYQGQNNVNRVYYRRSLPIKKNSAEENIKWGNEKLLSNNIWNKQNTQIALNDSTENIFKECDYPSIVVRKDGSLLKAYIMYTCDDNEDISTNVLAISIIDVSSPLVYNVLINKEFERFRGKNRVEFGTPVINASYSRNYVAWADSLNGIIVSTFEPNQIDWQDTLRMRKDVFFNNINTIANHPALNTYSSINSEEDNCALVWQQNKTPGSYHKSIYYTRLKVNNNNKIVMYGHPNNSQFLTPRHGNVIQLNNTIDPLESNEYPTIYRSVNELNYNSGNNKRQDYVYWQRIVNNYQSSWIIGKHILSYDINSDSIASAKATAPFRIIDNFKYTFSPNVSQQSSIRINNQIKQIYGSHVLNLVRASDTLNNSNTTYDTYNLAVYTNVFANTKIISANNINRLQLISKKTKQPHLALYHEQNQINNLWRNRRVYEEYTDNNYSVIPKIVSNGRYFYKNNVVEEIETEAFVGFHKGNYNYQVSLPKLDNQDISLILPYNEIIDSTGIIDLELNSNQDTIFSNWFDVNTVAELNFKCYGFNDTIMVAKIQKQSDNSFINLNLPLSTTNTTGKLGEYTLINGGLDSYRLCFVRLDTNYQYTETLILDGLPISDTVSLKSSSNNSNIVDLSGILNVNKSDTHFDLFINPNPADDIVYLTPLYNDIKNKNLVEVSIYDNLGNSIYTKVVKSGETFSFDTSKLAEGIYIINCNEKENEWLAPNFLKASKFIINR